MAFGKIDGAEPSTVTFQLRTVTHDINGATQHQEIVTIGGEASSLAVAAVLASAPASTAWALSVRQVGFVAASTEMTVRQSTVGDFRAAVYQSTAADLNVTVAGYVAPSTIVTVSTGSVRVHQSSAADLNVTVAGYVAPSTLLTVRQLLDSSGGSVTAADSANNAIRVNVVAGAAGGSTEITVRQSTVGALRVAAYQSTIADLQATVAPASTVWTVQARNTTSSGGGLEGSTVTATGNLLGLNVRPVFPTMESTTVLITSTNSTALYGLISSAAGVRHKVYAYSVTSTHTNPSTLVFVSSNAHDVYHTGFGSGSSGITGANLGITPPGFLFASVVANALQVRIEGGNSTAASTTIARVSISYFTEA